MKKPFLTLIALLTAVGSAFAVEDNTVEIVFSDGSATVTPASNISSYVTSSVDGAHVKIVQAETAGANTSGEILYILSGSSSNGSFYMEGSYKATLTLSGVTLTNPSGAAIDVQNGKRINVSIKNGTTNSLTDGENGDWKGCFVCKGHAEFKGKGTLTVNGKSGHGIWAKEYVEIKNCTINIPSPAKDGINCNQYFLMESGSLTITSPGDDGIQVSYKDDPPVEAEDTGNFTLTDGTVSISSPTNYCIKTDGTIKYNGGTRDFDTSNVLENAATGINAVSVETSDAEVTYDLGGRQLPQGSQLRKGVYIIRKDGKARKVILK
ncbi:MAG: carbohydrate-binding domain-containing protein [Bacteroidaceae bacterium]|nr:carbohydrate-binding domain-containing protein [Bacteroidaceae bacterium]